SPVTIFHNWLAEFHEPERTGSQTTTKLDFAAKSGLHADSGRNLVMTSYAGIVSGPPRPSLVLRPGMMVPGVERYQVEGAGAVLVEVEAGDRVTVRNLEGGQP